MYWSYLFCTARRSHWVQGLNKPLLYICRYSCKSLRLSHTEVSGTNTHTELLAPLRPLHPTGPVCTPGSLRTVHNRRFSVWDHRSVPPGWRTESSSRSCPAPAPLCSPAGAGTAPAHTPHTPASCSSRQTHPCLCNSQRWPGLHPCSHLCNWGNRLLVWCSESKR